MGAAIAPRKPFNWLSSQVGCLTDSSFDAVVDRLGGYA